MLKLKLQYFGHLVQRTDSWKKTLMLGKTEGKRSIGATENEMIGWYHQINAHESEQTPRGSEGQGCLACSVYGVAELDTIERLNKNKCSRDSQGKNTEVVCHSLLHCLNIKEELRIILT